MGKKMKWFKFDIRNLSDDEYFMYYSTLSSDRLEKIDSLKNNKDKKLSLAGEILAKKAVSEILSLNKEELQIKNLPDGKPYLENISLNLSISHSGDFAVCAVSKKPVGIDIQLKRDISLEVAKKFCNQDELNYINSSNTKNEQQNRFYEIWTAKEAGFKCGIAKSFKNINTLALNKEYHDFENYKVCIVKGK